MLLLAAVRTCCRLTCGRSRARPAPRAVALAGLEDRVALLANGTVDFVLATFSATPERAQQVHRPLHVQQPVGPPPCLLRDRGASPALHSQIN